MITKPFLYKDAKTPKEYICTQCGANKVRLYRQYSTSCVELLCRKCTIINENKVGQHIECEDNIGWMVAAIPTENGKMYWGYTSVPQDGVEWWRNLPKE